MKLIENYNKALQEIYDHVGFVEDYVVYPISDCTEHYWWLSDESIYYGETKYDVLAETDKYYSSEIYKQLFYSKWVYRGKDFTMIFSNPGVDGMKYFDIFDNSKEISEEERDMYEN